jgi:hypothetical protein
MLIPKPTNSMVKVFFEQMILIQCIKKFTVFTEHFVHKKPLLDHEPVESIPHLLTLFL